MNNNDLYRSIGEVEEGVLLRSETKTHRRHPALRVLAASLALVLGLWGISLIPASDAPADAPRSWFVVTARAADSGEEVELDTDNSVLNSALEKDYFDSGFSSSFYDPNAPKPAPSFSFSLNPTEWADNIPLGDASSYISLSVSYDGKEVDGRDKNVMIGYQIPTNEPAKWKYWIAGRFEEPRDVTITVTVRDAKTEEIIETIIVDVKYSADTEAYELSIVESQTFVAFQ